MAKWEMVRLGDVLSEAITGEWGEENDGGSGIQVLRTTNFTNEGTINYTNVVTRNISDKKVKQKKLIPGDIILEKSGGSDNQPVGRVVFYDRIDELFLCNNFTQILRINPKLAVNRYVFFYLHYIHRIGVTQLLQNKTTGIRNLQIKNYLALNVPLPNLSIQHKIADILDRANILIEKRKVQIVKLDMLVKSRFIEMFGDPVRNDKSWPIKKINEFALVKIGPFGSLLHAEDYIENGIPLVNPSHIIDGEIVPDMKLTLTLKKYDTLSAYALQVGDVVLGRRGEIGRCAVVNNGEYLCGTGSMFIRIKHDYLPMMLQRIISSETMRWVLEDKAVGVTMLNLNAGMIANLNIIMPPLPLQQRFADFVRAADKSKFILQQALDKQYLLYKSLMLKCFNGDIDITG